MPLAYWATAARSRATRICKIVSAHRDLSQSLIGDGSLRLSEALRAASIFGQTGDRCELQVYPFLPSSVFDLPEPLDTEPLSRFRAEQAKAFNISMHPHRFAIDIWEGARSWLDPERAFVPNPNCSDLF